METLVEAESGYPVEAMVAKKTDQVSRNPNGQLDGRDDATFEKLNQAMNSSRDLVGRFVTKNTPPWLRVIVPVLVVPTGLLWQVDYSPDGALVENPRAVTHASLFLDTAWSIDLKLKGIVTYRLSHIEIVTFGALRDVVDRWLGPSGFCPGCAESG